MCWIITPIVTSRAFPAELGKNPSKENGGAHDNNAPESRFDCYNYRQLFLLWDYNAQWFHQKIHHTIYLPPR